MIGQRGIFEKVPGSGIWWVCYFDQLGRKHREKAGSKSAAILLYRKRKQQVLEGKKLPEKLRGAPASFREISKDALEYSRATKVPDAYKIDCYHMKTIRSWFDDRAAEQITPQEIERKLGDLAETGRKPATLNRYRALISLVYSHAARNGKVSLNPVRQVTRRKENNVRVRFLEYEEEEAIRAKIRELCPEREPEFDLALHTGMRRGEQYRLRWQDADLRRGIITIQRSKHGGSRHIPINSTARASLTKLREQCDGIGYICPGFEGPRNRDRRRWFEEVVSEAQVRNFRWHDLRHTFCSRLAMDGVPLCTIQALAGHKRIETTLRYAHLAEGHLRDAIERLAHRGTDTRSDTKMAGLFAGTVAVSA